MPPNQSNFADRQAARLAAARVVGSTLPRRPTSPALIPTAQVPALEQPAVQAVPTLQAGDWLLEAIDALAPHASLDPWP